MQLNFHNTDKILAEIQYCFPFWSVNQYFWLDPLCDADRFAFLRNENVCPMIENGSIFKPL